MSPTSALLATPVAITHQQALGRRGGRAWRAVTVSNGFRTRANYNRGGQVWTPTNNKFFETFSYLPPLTDEQIAKQVENMVQNGWVPSIEFATPDKAATDFSSPNSGRVRKASPGYYDNRYWTMWKLPMFGITNPDQVLREIRECVAEFPTAYVRLVAFDSDRQTQMSSFLVHRPPTDARSNRNPMWQQE